MLSVALARLSSIAAKFKPEIQMVALVLTMLLGNQYLNPTTEFSLCLLALLRKYGTRLN
jgi:hypothetical protein